MLKLYFFGNSICFSLKNTACSHARADTHGNHAVFDIQSLKLVEHRDNHTCAGGTEWMTEGDGTSSLVEFVIWDAELLNTVGGLAGECLVNLPNVDVLYTESSLLECLWNGDGWADSHDLWRATCCSEAQEPSLDWKAKSLCS